MVVFLPTDEQEVLNSIMQDLAELQRSSRSAMPDLGKPKASSPKNQVCFTLLSCTEGSRYRGNTLTALSFLQNDVRVKFEYRGEKRYWLNLIKSSYSQFSGDDIYTSSESHLLASTIKEYIYFWTIIICYELVLRGFLLSPSCWHTCADYSVSVFPLFDENRNVHHLGLHGPL